MNKTIINNQINNNLTQSQSLNFEIKTILENKLTGEQKKELEEIYKTENEEEKKNKILEFAKKYGVVAVEIIATILKTLSS